MRQLKSNLNSKRKAWPQVQIRFVTKENGPFHFLGFGLAGSRDIPANPEDSTDLEMITGSELNDGINLKILDVIVYFFNFLA